MELTLQGDPTLHVEGEVVVELPDYMTLLDKEHLEEVNQDPNRGRLIVACGRHSSGIIMLMTGDGGLRELSDPGLPDGHVRPCSYGHAIGFDAFGYTSHPSADRDFNFEVSAAWVIENSMGLYNLTVGAVQLKTRRVSYLDG